MYSNAQEGARGSGQPWDEVFEVGVQSLTRQAQIPTHHWDKERETNQICRLSAP